MIINTDRLLRFASVIVSLTVSSSWGNTPDYMFDDFENGSLTIGLHSMSDVTPASFIYSYEKDGRLNLTYTQPDGQRDIAWYEGLTWNWDMVDVSGYTYFQLDVQGMEGGEDATVEFQYKDTAGVSRKPFIRLSDYAEITTDMQTINIPIEDFESFDKTRATAVALGFRYVTDGVDSMQIDNIGLSVYPSSFFYTHTASPLLTNTADFVFKPHYPQGATPCSAVSLVYAINGGSVVTSAMTVSGAIWTGTITNLAHGATVVYHFLHNYGAGAATPDYTYTHNSVIDHEAPSNPYDMDGYAASPTQVDLSWSESSDNIGVAGYKVYRNEVEIASASGTSYSAVNLNAGTAYTFCVRAFDAAGNLSGLSGSISVTTPVDSEAPSAPSSLAATVTGPTTIRLTWVASTDNLGVEGYQIMRDGVYHALTYQTNFIASGVAGSSHTFCVMAYDRAMNLSASSTPVQVTMPADAQPPSVPTGLTGVPNGAQCIRLTWNPSTDNGAIARYEIFRDGLLIERTDTTNADLFAQPSTAYSFAVRAVDSVGNISALSTAISVTSAAGDLPQLGSYAATVPAGYSTPPTNIYATTNMVAPFPSGDWWTSLLHVRCSGMMAARPISYYAKGWALEFSYPTATVSGVTLSAPFVKELAVQATGGSFPAKPNGSARVDGYGDFSVRTRIGNDDSYLTATLTHGSPFAYIRFTACAPSIACPLGYTVIASNAATSYLVVRIPSAAKTYALFAPSGTIWQLTSSTLITPVLPSGKDFLSVAILPDHGATYDASAFALLREHAYAFITNTTATFTYQRTNAMIRSTFTAQTETMQDGQTVPLLGLLPHHWKNSAAPILGALDYKTVLGALKITASGTFTTLHRYNGIVPQFPEPFDPSWSRSFFASLAENIAGVNGGQIDTYWHGKDIERIARVIPALDAAGLNDRRDFLLSSLRASLINMFTYTPGEDNQFFAYNPLWGALHGYNESYGSVTLMSDNHFHYGMFVYSAAILGIYDPFFAAEYRTIVDKIIRQYNNPSHDTSGADPLPWLRCFDPWEGHCWATGLGGTPQTGASGEVLYTGEKSVTGADGPDEESSSECMNAWAAMFLWGLVTGNDEFIDMGAAGYVIEADAIREYWYDADQNNYPSDFSPTMASRVFGSKVDALTWFSTDMDQVWGIQYILTGPHMTYQGYFKDYRKNIDYTDFQNAWGAENVVSGWKDIHWMYRCFFEADEVLAEYSSSETVNDGNTQANLYYWIHAMNSLGEVNTEIYSDQPALTVLSTDSATNFVAFNYTGGPVTARLYRASDDLPLGSILLGSARATTVRTDQDDDGDRLNNGAELACGTDLYRPDSDNDGMNDGDEVFAGVNPLDAASIFAFDIMKASDPQSVTFAWQGNPARVYRLWIYPTLADLAAGVNGSNLFQGVSGTGWTEYTAPLPAWTNGYLKLQAY